MRFAIFSPLMILVATTAFSAPLAEFTFDTLTGNPPPQPGYNPTILDPGVQVTGLTFGSGITSGTLEISNPSPNYASQPVLRVGANSSTNLTNSVASNSYFEFTVTPEAGQSVSLDSITLDAGRGGGSTPRGYGVFSDAIGYAVGDEVFQLDVPTQRPTFTNSMIDLSGYAEFQNITDPTTFRFNIYSPSSGSTLEFDNLTLNGSVAALPEPASVLAWVLLGGVAVTIRRRWRKSKA